MSVDVAYSMADIIVLMLTVILLILYTILPIISMWKIFEKAGEPGWAAIVPFMAQYKLCKISLGNGLFFLLLIVPFVNFIVAIMIAAGLAKAFGKGSGFAFGLIFLPFIFYIILGFGSAVYQKK